MQSKKMENQSLTIGGDKMKKKVVANLVGLFVLMFIIGLTGCNDPNVIGLTIDHDGAAVTTITMHYFPTKNDAINYYTNANIKTYWIFIKTDDYKTKKFFDNCWGDDTGDGGKTLTFLADPGPTGELAYDKYIDFMKNNHLSRLYSSVQDSNN